MSRLIDADALVETMQADEPEVWLPDDAYSLGLHDQHLYDLTAVEAAPTVCGWISVKDRFPGEWITVLTFQPTLSDGEGLIRTAVYIGTGKWREAERHELMELPVTHWMPLPEKPEEEDNAPD